MTSEEMQELIYRTIENISQDLLNKTNYLYVVEGKITEVDSLGNGYVFEYQSEKYNGFSITGETYSVDDLVYVLFSNNKNIKKMILSKTKNFSNNDINRFVKKTNKSISEIKLENDEISLSVKNNKDAISQININLNEISLSVKNNEDEISQIKIDNEQISLEVTGKVGKDEVISCINQTPESITIKAQKISLEGVVTANNYFQILEDGSMRAVNSDFSGRITATGGRIGRYDITSTYLMTGSGSTATGMGGNQAFWAGASDSNSAPFRVSYNGSLYSTDATIGGTISGTTINGGTISGTTINGGSINGSTLNTSEDVNVGRNINMATDEGTVTRNINFGSNARITYSYTSSTKWNQMLMYSKMGERDVQAECRSTGTDATTGFEVLIATPSKITTHSFGSSLSRIGSNLTVFGNLSSTGTKNRMVQTVNYGKRLMNAVESADAFFEDFGTAMTDAEGFCEVQLDDIFLETVNTDYDYHVFLTPYSDDYASKASIYSKSKDRFIVYGTPYTRFDWRISAKQKGYEETRMEVMEDNFEDEAYLLQDSLLSE